MKRRKYYAVRKGKKPGIYRDWPSCKEQVIGYSGSEYKSFKTEEEALSFMNIKDNRIQSNDGEIKDEKLHIFVDGSYEEKTHRFSYGLIGFYKKESFEDKKAYDMEEYANHRNVSGELFGAYRALEIAKELNVKEINLYYDYEGIEKWATNQWKTNTLLTKEYAKKMEEYQKTIKINFYKIKSHSGHPHNERADELAKEALKERK